MKKNIIYKLNTTLLISGIILLGLVASCFDDGFEEFVPPTGNVNGIQPNTLFTTTTSADNSLSIVFRSFSTDAVSYAWDFGDGTTSDEANPTHTYAEGGLFFVQLITIDSNGAAAVANTNVSPVFIDFDFTIVDTEVVFTNNTTGAQSLIWDFGDGETVVWNSANGDVIGDANYSPTHIYRSDDVFDVTLTVVNFLAEADEEFNADLNENEEEFAITTTQTVSGLILSTVPDFTFAVNDLEVTFTDNSLFAVSRLWDFGDGSPTSTELNPVHTYATEGTFDVTLTTTNDAGTSRSVTMAVPVGAIVATFPAVIQNGSMEDFPTAEMNNNDLVDPWTIDPDNTFNDGTNTPFNFWRNDDLEAWVSAPANNGGSGTTDKGSSSGTNAMSAGGTSARSFKFDSSGERLYQPFEVETGVAYSISAFIMSETTPIGDLEGTFYILSDEPAADTDLASLALATIPVTSLEIGGWQQIPINFTADATFNFPQNRVDESIATGGVLTSVDQDFVIIYFVPTTTVTTDNEVFITDVIINTPGF